MNDLTVEVRHQDIIVTKPGSGLCVTYRRVPNSLCWKRFARCEAIPCEGVEVPHGGLEGRPRQSEGAWLACTLTGRNRAKADLILGLSAHNSVQHRRPRKKGRLFWIGTTSIFPIIASTTDTKRIVLGALGTSHQSGRPSKGTTRRGTQLSEMRQRREDGACKSRRPH